MKETFQTMGTFYILTNNKKPRKTKHLVRTDVIAS